MIYVLIAIGVIGFCLYIIAEIFKAVSDFYSDTSRSINDFFTSIKTKSSAKKNFINHIATIPANQSVGADLASIIHLEEAIKYSKKEALNTEINLDEMSKEGKTILEKLNITALPFVWTEYIHAGLIEHRRTDDSVGYIEKALVGISDIGNMPVWEDVILDRRFTISTPSQNTPKPLFPMLKNLRTMIFSKNIKSGVLDLKSFPLNVLGFPKRI